MRGQHYIGSGDNSNANLRRCGRGRSSPTALPLRTASRAANVILNGSGKAVSCAADGRKVLTEARAQRKHDNLMRARTRAPTKFVALARGHD
jgi:hypothetical protein